MTPFVDVYRPLLAKQRSPKMQVEHVTNAETVIGRNGWMAEKLQRTLEFYTQNFMFLLRLQQIFFPILCFHLYWKILPVPSLTKNTLICYNIILKAVL